MMPEIIMEYLSIDYIVKESLNKIVQRESWRWPFKKKLVAFGQNSYNNNKKTRVHKILALRR